MSLTLVFLVGYHGAKEYGFGEYGVSTGLISLMMFMMIIRPSIENFQFQVAFGRFGGTGMIPAFFAGIVTIVISNLYFKLHWFEDSEAIPDFLVRWLNQVIPGIVVLVLTTTLIYGLNLDLFALITQLFSPLIAIGQTFPGFLLCIFIPAFFYSFGVNSWFMNHDTDRAGRHHRQCGSLCQRAGAGQYLYFQYHLQRYLYRRHGCEAGAERHDVPFQKQAPEALRPGSAGPITVQYQ